jgi:hypothetical protein
MNAAERRARIMDYLAQHTQPISATALAKQFSVSRQIIVGDIALLRAAGEDISATPRGYLLSKENNTGLLRRIACLHTGEQSVEELMICVDHGCSVVDVVVEHPVYGQIVGQLQISSRYDIQQFVKKVSEQSAHSLLELTDGIHLHTLSCPSEDAYQRVCQALDKAGILLKAKE